MSPIPLAVSRTGVQQVDMVDARDVAGPHLVAADALGCTYDTKTFTQKAVVKDDLVRMAAKLVDASGIPAQLATWRADEHPARLEAGTHPGGRPPTTDDRLILILWAVLGMSGEVPQFELLADLVHHRLTPEASDLLGLQEWPTKHKAVYDRLWRGHGRMLARFDPFPMPDFPDELGHRAFTRWKVLKRERAAWLRAWWERPEAAAWRAERLERANWVTNRYLNMGVFLLPRAVRRRHKGNMTVDATILPCADHRTAYRPEYAPIHVGAGLYRRDRNHLKPGEKKFKRANKVLFGYEAELIAWCRNEDSDLDEFPLVIAGMGYHRPGARIAETAVAALTQAIRWNGHKTGYLVGDRAYFAGQNLDKFHKPVRALGFKVATGYKSDQLGQKGGQSSGAIWVDGSPYCPLMEQPLIDASRDKYTSSPDRPDKETVDERIDSRETFLVVPLGRPNANGDQKHVCPHGSGRLACPRGEARGVKASPNARLRIAEIPADKEHLTTGACCTNKRSFTIRADENEKLRQDVRFLSPLWNRIHGHARNTIESLNNAVKGSGCWLKDAAAIQARGYTSRYFLTAVVVLAYNVRTVTRWLETHPDLEPTPLPDRTNRRRDREHTEPWRFIAATDDDPPDPSIDDGEDERLDPAA